MLEPEDLKPLQRQALLAVLQSPTRSLRRCPKGFAAAPVAHASGAARVPVFTGRLMNMLERDNLVDFDPPRWPERVTLTPTGKRLAEALHEGMARRAKAGPA